jgi:hypothetical protein
MVASLSLGRKLPPRIGGKDSGRVITKPRQTAEGQIAWRRRAIQRKPANWPIARLELAKAPPADRNAAEYVPILHGASGRQSHPEAVI